MPPKEVIRLQTALLNFSLKVYPGKMGQISECLGVCARYLSGQDVGEKKDGGDATGGGGVKFDAAVSSPRKLDDVAVEELEKLLSIPLDSLALRVLELEHYSDLLTFLPWDNRRQVAVVMLNAVLTSGKSLIDLGQIEEMFSIVAPLIQGESTGGSASGGDADGGVSRTADLMGALGVGSGPGSDSFDGSGADPISNGFVEEQILLGKLVHLLSSDDTDTAHEMLTVARRHLKQGGKSGWHSLSHLWCTPRSSCLKRSRKQSLCLTIQRMERPLYPKLMLLEVSNRTTFLSWTMMHLRHTIRLVEAFSRRTPTAASSLYSTGDGRYDRTK